MVEILIIKNTEEDTGIGKQNEINSYNSLSMNQSNKPEIKSSKLYSSSKVLIKSDLTEKMKKTQINISKKVILNINNVNGNILNIENGGNINNWKYKSK